MYRLNLALLGLIAVLTACSGGSAADREAAKGKSRPTAVAACDVIECGVPCRVRFFDGGSLCDDGDVDEWEWNLRGHWEDYTPSQGEVWFDIDRPGDVQALLRVSCNGAKSTPSKVRLKLRRGIDAPPVILIENTDEFRELGGLRYHHWEWNTGKSYDPDSFDWTIERNMLEVGIDLDGDGELDEALVRCGSEDPDLPNLDSVDLDGDLIPDLLCRTLVLPHVLEVAGRALSDGGDVYVWKLTTTGNDGKKNTHPGTVTILK